MDFNDFGSVAAQACGWDSYSLTITDGQTVVDTLVTVPSAGMHRVQLLPGNDVIKGIYTFTILLQAGQGFYSYTSPEWTLNVVCGPLSTVVVITAAVD